MPAYSTSPPYPRGLYRGDKAYSFGALVAVAIAASPGGLSRAASGVVTCTTSAAHKALPGEIATIVGSTSVGGTRFDGNYFIQAAAFASSILTLVPVDDIILHQAPDTGGVGTITLIQMEQPALLTAGRAFGLMQPPDAGAPFLVDGSFDAAPGAFEVDVQVAQVDVAAAYETAVVINTLDASGLLFHANVNDPSNFVRAFLRARANGVNLAVSIRG